MFAGREGDLVQRHQLSTTCKEHATDVVEQLITYFSQLSNNHHAILVPRMLDMAEQFRAASAEVICRHVFGIGDTTRSEDLLRSLLEPGSVVAPSVPELFEDSLTKYGPGLITGFVVHQDFKNKATQCHVGAPTGSSFNKFGKQRRFVLCTISHFLKATIHPSILS